MFFFSKNMFINYSYLITNRIEVRWSQYSNTRTKTWRLKIWPAKFSSVWKISKNYKKKILKNFFIIIFQIIPVSSVTKSGLISLKLYGNWPVTSPIHWPKLGVLEKSKVVGAVVVVLVVAVVVFSTIVDGVLHFELSFSIWITF